MALKVRTRIYELLMLVDPDQVDSQLQGLLDEVTGFITTKGGEIIKAQVWGKRKLAYEVKNKRFGVYLLVHYKGTGELNRELAYRLQINDSVFKHLIIQIDEKDYEKMPALPDITLQDVEAERPARRPRGEGRGEHRRDRDRDRDHGDDGDEDSDDSSDD